VPSGWIQASGSNAAWVVANDAAYDGTLSLKSGFIGAGQHSDLMVTRNFAAGNVTFARKVSSQAGDPLQFFIDGVAQGAWTGEQDWTVVTYAIPAGTHTLLWSYSKDGAGSSGSDAAWIDAVTLPATVACIERRCAPK
jgi:hypothetical protein